MENFTPKMAKILDEILTKLTAQGGPSHSNNSVVLECCYKNQEGARCAVGVLIPDDLYHPIIEGNPAKRLPDVILKNIFQETPTEIELAFLGLVQSIHDRYNWAGGTDWEEYLREEFAEIPQYINDYSPADL